MKEERTQGCPMESPPGEQKESGKEGDITAPPESTRILGTHKLLCHRQGAMVSSEDR